ncbi:hypothetical protein L596_010482 [Steinernema carpocapsae]|uniref:Uncharacterized protein n=1 Tax=Steinernema carpocapsae TaxID=34508 RepID=A0A4U5PIH9_STECR|nr:hypothetical protein L596_010482 [Steinernema carpocapsae]
MLSCLFFFTALLIPNVSAFSGYTATVLINCNETCRKGIVDYFSSPTTCLALLQFVVIVLVAVFVGVRECQKAQRLKNPVLPM